MLRNKFLYPVVLLMMFILVFCFKPHYNKVTDCIYIEDGLNMNEINTAQNYLDCMPECIRTKFTDEQWKIIITSKIGRGRQYGLIGHTSIEDKTVYIVSGHVYDCLLHEFAHIYLDEHPYGDDFLEIYEKEAKAIVTAYYSNFDYYYTDPVEFYCTAWTIVNFRKEDYLGVAPETFAYFTDLFNHLYGIEEA